MTPPAPGTKQELRRRFRLRRRQLLAAAEAGLQQQARLRLPELLAPGQLLGLYWPLPGEVDLRGLAALPQLQGRLALPRVCGSALTYRNWQPGAALEADDTGIPAPCAGAPLAPEQLGLLLAPALACDRRGIRLGYGGGWFDRLRSQAAWRSVPALAVLPAGCLVAELPADAWDVPFDGWLDEQGLHRLQPV